MVVWRAMIVRCFLMLSLLSLVGCGGSFSYFAQTTSGGQTSCTMKLQNKSLDEVCKKLAEKLEASVVIDPAVNSSQPVTTDISKSSWLDVLKTMADELGLKVESDLAKNQHTIKAS